MKHTPGPWRLGNCASVVAGSKKEDDFYGGRLICESIDNKANARLISAAPDLLEACKALDEWRKSDSGNGLNAELLSKAAFKALEAIQKAEG